MQAKVFVCWLAAVVCTAQVGNGVGVAAAIAATANGATYDFGEYAVISSTVGAPTGADDVIGGTVIAYDNVGINDGVEFSVLPERPSLAVTPCNVNEPRRSECMKGLFDQILPRLKEGLPEYGMASIDPYFYKRGIFRYNNDGVQGGLLIKNVYIHGPASVKVNSVLSNFTDNNFVIKLGLEMPQLSAAGQFKADFKFGGLRLAPKGPFNITIDNIRATVLTDGSIMNTEVGQRLKLHRLNANLALGNAHIIANGIFTDRNLNSMILNLVNENLPEITRVGIPATREQWAPIVVEHVNAFFANVPIDKFLVQ